MKRRLVIVEDIPYQREFMARFCEQEIECAVVGTCGSVNEARALISQQRPQLALMEVCLGEETAFELVDWAAQECPDTRCVLMSAQCTDAMAVRAFKSRISGFIDKCFADAAQFKLAMECLVRGNMYYSPQYWERVIRSIQKPAGFAELLTEREQLILALLGHAMSDAEIAEYLGITLGTAQTHHRNILGKLQLGNTPRLMRYAIECGVTQLIKKPLPALYHGSE